VDRLCPNRPEANTLFLAFQLQPQLVSYAEYF